jgi:hypothetical protein
MFSKKIALLAFVSILFVLGSLAAPAQAEGLFGLFGKKSDQQESSAGSPVYNTGSQNTTATPLYIKKPQANKSSAKSKHLSTGAAYTATAVLKAKPGMTLAELSALDQYNKKAAFAAAKQQQEERIAQLTWMQEQEKLEKEQQQQQEETGYQQPTQSRPMVYRKQQSTSSGKPKLLFNVPR